MSDYVKKDKNTVRASLGFRQSIVEKASKISQFGNMYGCEVEMANGDTFGIYHSVRSVVEAFKPGVLLTYEYIKEIDYPGLPEEKIKFRIQNHYFTLPRQDRFESMVVEKISDAIFESARLAAAMGVNSYFDENANKIYTYLKHKLLQETFDFNENDTKKVVGTRAKKTEK